MTRAEQKARFVNMVAAYDHNHNRMSKISRDMILKAEAITRADRPKQRQYGRHKATWTGADERYFLDRFFELEASRQAEITSLQSKMRRQAAGIETLAHKIGLNDPPNLKSIPPIHPGICLPR